MSSTPQPSQIYTSPREVQLTANQVQPPSPLYIQAEDSFAVNLFAPTIPVISNLVLIIRWLRPDGEIITTRKLLPPTPWVAPVNFTFGEGFLLSATVVPLGAIASEPGQVFVTFTVQRDLPEMTVFCWVLFADYLTNNHYPSWPYGRNTFPQEGPGRIRSITGTAPGAGNNISETVPASVRWRLMAIRATLSTSAVVANRSVQWVLDDGANIIHQAWDSYTQAASQGIAHEMLNLGFAPAATVAAGFAPMPEQVMLAAGFRIRTITISLDGGDVFTAPQYLVQEWVDV